MLEDLGNVAGLFDVTGQSDCPRSVFKLEQAGENGNGISWECQFHEEAISAQNSQANHCGVYP